MTFQTKRQRVMAHRAVTTCYLVVVYKILQLISMYNYVEAAVLGKTELFIVHASKANLLPRSRTVREIMLCYTRHLLP